MEYMHASGYLMTGLEDLFDCLRLRYGVSQDCALDKFLAMRQRAGESARAYGDRVLKNSYGTGLPDATVMHHYKKTLSSARVRELLIVGEFSHI